MTYYPRTKRPTSKEDLSVLVDFRALKNDEVAFAREKAIYDAIKVVENSETATYDSYGFHKGDISSTKFKKSVLGKLGELACRN